MNRFFKGILGAFAIAALAPIPAAAQSNPNAVVTVASVARLNAGNYLGSPFVQLQGYYTAGDGGAGGLLIYNSSDTTSANNGATIFVDGAGHRYYRAKNVPVSVLEGGAKCDASTDDTTRINATIVAVSALNPTGAVVTFPMTQCKTTNGILAASNLTLRGPGKGIGGILENDAAATHGAAIYGSGLSNVTIQGLRVIGSWQSVQNDTGDRCTYFVNGFNISHLDSECGYSRGIGFSVNVGSNNRFLNNYLHHNARDNISCEDCQAGEAGWNVILHGGDDAIAWHVSPSASAPVRGLVSIHDNQAEDAFGFKALGLKNGSIINNTCRLCKGYMVYITSDAGFSEGSTSGFNVTVSNNRSTDIVNPFVYDGSNNINSCIVVGSFAQAGSGTLPFYSNGSTIATPWGKTWNNRSGSSTVTISPGYAIDVSNNNCTRSLPDGVAYASYQFNPANNSGGTQYYMFTASGWINPTITAGTLNGTGILINGFMQHSRIANNILFTGSYGINIAANGITPLFLDDLTIESNTIGWAENGGIETNLGSPNQLNIKIINNSIDCDPFLQDSNRLSTGGWTNGSAFPDGIDIVRVQGATTGGNHIRNCYFATRTDVDTIYAHPYKDTLYLNPAVVGYNAGNIGIGNVPSGEHYVIISGDPTSPSTFNHIANDNYETADLSGGCPSTGTWVTGVYVVNTVPVITGGKVLIACSRLTVGNSNVLNTDWSAIYGTNS